MKSALISVLGMLAISAAHAQPTPETQRLNAQVVPCMGGTGAAITSIGTTPTLVCNGNSQNRRWYFSIQSTSLSASNYAYCTANGTTPSATNWTLYLFQAGLTSNGMGYIPAGPIWCISGTSTALPIAADAAQTGVAP